MRRLVPKNALGLVAGRAAPDADVARLPHGNRRRQGVFESLAVVLVHALVIAGEELLAARLRAELVAHLDQLIAESATGWHLARLGERLLLRLDAVEIAQARAAIS